MDQIFSSSKCFPPFPSPFFDQRQRQSEINVKVKKRQHQRQRKRQRLCFPPSNRLEQNKQRSE